MKLKKTIDDILEIVMKAVWVICVLAVVVWLVPLVWIAFAVFTEFTIFVVFILASVRFGFLIAKLLKRRRFLRELEKYCRGMGCRLRRMGHPYGNVLFHVRAGAEMEYKDKTVVCWFISSKRKRTPLCVKPDGSVIFYHSIRVRGITLLSWRHIWRFCEEPMAGSFLLLLPAPNMAYAEHFEKNAQLDNGGVVGPFTVYTGGAFLRYLERSSYR